jgi:sigma-B regulation protein RsbU (phosphoserine phosphatase)
MFDNGWLFSVQIPVNEIFAEIETRNNQFIIIIAGSFIALLLITAYLLSRLINRPLRKLTSGVAELGGGDLNKQIDIRSKDEFGALAAAFNKMTVDLKESIEQSARERAEKERIGAELNVATQIQADMLPSIFPAFPYRNEFDIYASMQPAKEVGGDFYDFFLVDGHTLAVVIADVSGKGVPAALFMVITKTLIQNTSLSGKSPEAVFGFVNKMLCENNDAGMFVTAILGFLDIPTGKFTFVNAGHNPPLLKREGEVFNWLKVRANFVLAGDEDTRYARHEITLNPGDELFLYTDGVTEAVNIENELFGDRRLLETANNNLNLPLQEFAVSIKREIDTFAGGAERADDITMLALRYKGLG